jgi:hypothetical protein
MFCPLPGIVEAYYIKKSFLKSWRDSRKTGSPEMGGPPGFFLQWIFSPDESCEIFSTLSCPGISKNFTSWHRSFLK